MLIKFRIFCKIHLIDSNVRSCFVAGEMDTGAAKVSAEEEEVRKVAGLAKIGLGYGGNIMAEMRARQEKRTSVLARVSKPPSWALL